jgi:hypothetical protein
MAFAPSRVVDACRFSTPATAVAIALLLARVPCGRSYGAMD